MRSHQIPFLEIENPPLVYSRFISVEKPWNRVQIWWIAVWSSYVLFTMLPADFNELNKLIIAQINRQFVPNPSNIKATEPTITSIWSIHCQLLLDRMKYPSSAYLSNKYIWVMLLQYDDELESSPDFWRLYDQSSDSSPTGSSIFSCVVSIDS